MDNASNRKTKIYCDAKNCVHHTDECGCSADIIKVGCKTACSCKETSCATFQLKS